MGQRKGKKKKPSIEVMGVERREEQRLIWRRAATTYRAKKKAKTAALLEEREQLREKLEQLKRVRRIDVISNR